MDKQPKLKELLKGYWVFFYMVVTALVSYNYPRSVLAFTVFLAGLPLVFYAKIPVKVKLVLAGAYLGVLLPVIGGQNAYNLEVVTQIGIYVALALGLNVVVGFTGLLDIGYIAFYATGAYLYAIFASGQANQFISASLMQFPVSGAWFFLFIPVAVILAAMVGALLGLPVLRLKGDYLAIVTLGFGEIIRIIINNLDKPVNITNGPQGITSIKPPLLFGLTLDQPVHYYFIVVAMVVMVLLVTRRLEVSYVGRAWVAIREDEIAARAMGIPIVKMKLLAFATGAAIAGAMGVVFAAKQTFIDPTSFTVLESIEILVIVILGGMGSIPGVVLGAGVVLALKLQLLKSLSDYFGYLRVSGILDIPTQLEPAKYEKLVFGVIIILMMIFRSQGLIPAKRRQIHSGNGEDE